MLKHFKLNHIIISNQLKVRLREIMGHQITTVIAPMGYGKTTAIKWWERYYARRMKDAVILRQIISTDRVTDFWNGFCNALRGTPELMDQVRALGYPEDVYAMDRLNGIFQEALEESSGPIYYILDDVYILKCVQITRLLTFLAARLPERVHFILISRNQIFNEVDKFHFGSNLCEITISDLQLSTTEILRYAERCEVSLSVEEAERIADSSEGWIAMIYLIFHMYVQTNRWKLDAQDIFMLMDQVMLQPLPARHQEFLVMNSATKEFTAAQAAWLWQEEDAQPLLESLTRNNAFITADQDGIYRYHHMLRQCTRKRFQHLPESTRALVFRRLGRWYFNRQEFVASEQYFYRAGDWNGLMDALAADCSKSRGGADQQDIFCWSSQCPIPVLQGHPDAVLTLMLKLFTFRRIPEMLRLKRILLSSLEANTTLTEVEKNNYLGECELMMSFLQYNDISAMSAFHRKAGNMMNRTSMTIDSNRTWTFGSPSIVMMFHRTCGGLDREIAQMRQCMPFYDQIVNGHGSGAEYSMQGEADFLRGRLTDAEIGYHLAENAAMGRGQYSILVTAKFLAMRIALFTGAYERMEDILDRLRILLKQEKQDIMLNTLDLCEAWLMALLNRPEEVPQGVMSPEAMSALMYPAMPMLMTIQNQVLLAEGELTKLISRSGECAATFEGGHTLLCTIYLHIHLAAAQYRLGRQDDAGKELKTALDLALPDGLHMPFVGNGRYLSELLQTLQHEGIYVKEIGEVLTLMDAFSAGGQTIQNAQWHKVPSAGLTKRELQIVGLAADRKSNYEIAQELSLSEGTVKIHLNHVYDKLGIAGRVGNKRLLLPEILRLK